MIYEYQVLESDSPAVPPDLLNEQGKEGWKLCGITVRDTRPPEPEEQQRWIFYFTREKPAIEGE